MAYKISGVVTDAGGAFAERLIRAYHRDTGVLVGSVMSNAITGEYSIEVASDAEHFVVAHDTNRADQLWADVVLAMHMDDVVLSDSKRHPVTLGGNVARSPTKSKFGGYSAAFDGAGDYISLGVSSDWDFGTGDFTVEIFASFVSHASVMELIGNYSGASAGWGFQWRNDTNILNFHNGDTTLAMAEWQPSDGVMYHLAVCRASGYLRIFVDGVQVGLTAVSTLNIAGSLSPLLIGNLYVGGSYVQGFNGYVDDVRITRAARYSANFTPPTSAFASGAEGGTENAVILDRVTPV